MEALAFHTTKPFMSGRSQAIRIPKEYQFDDIEVIINRVGESLVITPKTSLKDAFNTGLSMLSDDFLADGRPEEVLNTRVEL
ncbi:MAG: type II toxin-antitoxin system VapB family antitoxin [Lachnospiraceae bacterium]|nr:type II toxin-antitoxin system VapB family antitoxin [Lachnospiraceae bacterium]